MILIVDDKPENLYSLKKLLNFNNFEVDTAASGEEALKKILKNHYALIILDVQMPGMDGFEVAETISGYSRTEEVPIIFLSAVNTDKKFITRGYDSGGIDYITKPIDPDILLLKVKTFLKLYEQKQALTAIQKALLEEIETRKAAEKKKDEFISIASHELKTPLTSIQAYLQLSQRTLHHDPATTAEHLNRTKLQLNKLNRLVEDLLDLSKIENGKLKFNECVFQFQPFIQNAIEMIRETHNNYKIKIIGDANPKLYGDANRIEQVIVNYLTNAIKYSPNSDEVHLITSIVDDQLEVRVRDFGIGIPAEKQATLFQKYVRIEETSHRFQGMGIGLYICAEILARHKGTYGVTSTPGKGSDFYFTLPIYQESQVNIHDQVI